MMTPFSNMTALQHGGNLATAIAEYDIAAEHWLDLSTGVSPWSWPSPAPFPELDESVWRDLPPAENTQLLKAAALYYQCNPEQLCASPGSQLLIRLLPQLAANATAYAANNVAVPLLGYQEHALSWHMAGFQLVFYENAMELNALISQQKVQHAVIINPNNPSTDKFSIEQARQWAEQLPGLLVVDEAFIDITPDLSVSRLLSETDSNNINNKLLILRSVGKFFGLAGIRLGFLLTNNKALLNSLNALLQPWSINHAAITIAAKAFADQQWQSNQQQRIAVQSQQMKELLTRVCDANLTRYSLKTAGLFTTIIADKNELNRLHTTLAKHAIWTRFSGSTHSAITNNLAGKNMPAWLRLSLPGNKLQHLQKRLTSL